VIVNCYYYQLLPLASYPIQSQVAQLSNSQCHAVPRFRPN